MKNLQQMHVINHSLTKEREKLFFEIVRMNTLIEKKKDLIKRMLSYQNEYKNNPSMHLTRSVPILTKNFESFSKKLQDIVIKEEREIKSLMQTRDTKVTKVNVLDQKIKLLQQFAQEVLREIQLNKDKVEQLNMDDLSVTKKSRGYHE